MDFQDLKARFPIENAIPLLGLTMKQNGRQWRGACPRCNGNDRSLTITQDKGYYCFKDQKGGDVIALVAHVLNTGARDAAQKIADHIGTVPQEPTGSKPTVSEAVKEKATPTATTSLQPLAYLVYDHEQVRALGLDAETAQALGIGHAPKGLMRGRVVLPIYHKRELVGYAGIASGADVKLPTNLKERVTRS